MRTLALERLLAHVARAGEAMGRPGAIPRSDGHITTRGEVLGPARPSLRLFSKGARETRSKQSHVACMSDAQTTFASLPNAQTACPRLSGVPSSHHLASRVPFDGHKHYGSGNCPDLCVACPRNSHIRRAVA